MFSETIDFIKSLYPGKEFIPLHEPFFDQSEKDFVMDAIDSTYVSSVGKYVDEFEDRIKDFTNAPFAIAAVNGTAALHMCLILAEVKAGDLVITQAMSFIATCNAISYVGARPLFLDINKNTLGLSAASLQEFLENNCVIKNGECILKSTGQKISACVPMHSFGHAVEIEKILELCEKYQIVLIEDAAESIGSYYKGKHTGTFGELGAFSFNGNKTITCGGGGIIVTNNQKLASLAKHLTTQAKVPHRWEFNHDYVGYNYRLPNLNAAMACAQMEKLSAILENKRTTATLYKEFFRTQNIQFFEEPSYTKSNYWLNAIVLSDINQRNLFLNQSNTNGVMSRPAWTLMNKIPMFKDCICEDLTNSNFIEERLVNIPSSYRV